MDSFVLGLFLFAAILGGFASGLAGFAMGFIVTGIWLHIITPIQTTALVAGYGLLTQGYGVWKLRHALAWKNITPFIIGGIFGIPIGTALLTYSDPAYLRGGAACNLRRLWPYAANAQADAQQYSNRYRHRIRQWGSGWFDRTAGIHHHNLVSIAWLEERLSARSVPAGIARGHCCKRHVVSCRSRHHRRHSTTVLDRSAGDAYGPLGWVQALWKTQRCSFPQDYLGALTDCWVGFDPAACSVIGSPKCLLLAQSGHGLLRFSYLLCPSRQSRRSISSTILCVDR